jgi:hypothetical protein
MAKDLVSADNWTYHVPVPADPTVPSGLSVYRLSFPR